MIRHGDKTERTCWVFVEKKHFFDVGWKQRNNFVENRRQFLPTPIPTIY